VPLNAENEVEPVDGNDIYTTIDINIQDIAENALRNALIQHDAAWGTAIVMEVKTGKIKAITNLTRIEPAYYEERYNYAIAELVEPGSTFKLFSLLALYEDGFVDPWDSVDLNNGTIQFYNRTMSDSEGKHHYRNVTVETAFAKSSNVGISRLVNENYKSDKEKFLKHISDIGLDTLTGVDIAGEPNPKFKLNPKAKNFSGVTMPWMSVGYELQITPLQLLNFYNAVANDGKLMRPMLVSEIRSYGALVETNKPEVLNNKICSDKTLKKLQKALMAVVDSGTAKNIRNDYYKIAGKTGTAQLLMNGRYTDRYLASFAGYFPADQPKYSCIVMVNSPSNGLFYGGYVAAPVFREIADKVYSHHISMATAVNKDDSLYHGVSAYSKGYRYDFEEILDWFNLDNQLSEDADWIVVHPVEDTLKAQPVHVKENVMPSVKGMGLRDALYVLENQGLKVDVSGKGKVLYQSIAPGENIRKGMYVMIKLG
ncbi:MAG: penicillin-binding protein, partial [Chitinophagales bacterium]